MLVNDEVNRYLLSIYKTISVSVGEAYASGVFHAYSFLGNRVSWYDVRNKSTEISDKYFDEIVATGKGFGKLDVSDRYAEIKGSIERLEKDTPNVVWIYLQQVSDDFRCIAEKQSILAYRKGVMNTYIENGVEYVKLKCTNEWCQGYDKHSDKIFKIGTEPKLPLNYCSGDYRPYRPSFTDMLNAETVKGFTKKESEIMAETDEKIQKILDEAEDAVLRIMKLK